MTPPARQHHVDALRAFAMLLGVGLHAALSFSGTPWIVVDRSTDEAYRWFFEAVHGFRMQLFFFVSGYFTMLLYRRRGLNSLVEQRFQRVLVPLLLGFVTVVPALQWVSVWAADNAPRPAVSAGKSALVEAVKKGDAVAVTRLAAGGADPNAPDPETGLPPLGWAALYGDAGAARALLDAGADPNGKDRAGYRPLHSAVFLGHPEVAGVLLDRGADPAARGANNDGPRESAKADWNTTKFLAGLLKVPLRTEDEVRAGRAACLALLDRHAAGRETGGWWDVARARLDALRADYREFLTSPQWGLRLSQQGPPVHLILANQFSHLWFLWFLCWFVAGFALVALAAGLVRLPRLPGGLVLSPLRLLWLVPLTLVPQLFMGVFFPTVGPDTSAGVVPEPHLLVYYGLFFAAGAVYHDADDRAGRLGRWWWAWLGVAAAVLVPAKEYLNDPVVTGVFQVVYAWAATFGLFGLFRWALGREYRAVRYLSDSAYWLYLVHLPLVVLAQAWVREWEYPAWAKFWGICLGVTAVLLVAYQLLVRHTYVGVILNGRRPDIRPVPEAGPARATSAP
ncbi:MAG: acyltransferase family protein [Gemmataceae bacterium]|nr:acyltransferase family protein [Gemmataceae bacterium]